MERMHIMTLENAPAPYGPTPSDRQLAWHGLEFYGFLHFGPNTFTDDEWGFGDKAPELFNPTDFDADQIVETAAAGGMKGLVLTCKHHDGFCLWPSAHTEYSVKNSPWEGGQGDVVGAISGACRRAGLLFGAYLSPWDRNHTDYATPAYVDYYRRQLEELTSQYGDLFEVWFDGANGGDGYYGGANETRSIDRRTYYDWENTWAIVRRNQPMACIFSDAGPEIRWVGNEKGIAGDPCWATITTLTLVPGLGGAELTSAESDMVKAWGTMQGYLNQGVRNGEQWQPAECDVSIRPGWFYHAHEDDKVRSVENLVELYFQSVGRGASFHLNLPPDRRGRIHETDVAHLKGFRQRLDAIFATNLAADAEWIASNTRRGSEAFSAPHLVDGSGETYWATDDGETTPSVELAFAQPVTVNVLSLREYLPLGQRVDAFALDVEEGGTWREIAAAESIGSRRLLQFPTVTAKQFRLRITAAPVCPALSELALHFDPERG